MSSHKCFAVNLFYLSKLTLAQVLCKYNFSLMNYLTKNLQLFSLHISGECYIFKCVKTNLFLKIKLETFLVI